MPVQGTTYVDAVLTQFSLKYRNSEYIADRVAPIVPVTKTSGKYFVYGRENFTIPESLRAPGTLSSTVGWSVSTDEYQCYEYALNDLIDEIIRDDADASLNIEQSTVEYLTDMILLGREKRVADLVTNASTFANTEPNPNWNEASCTPIADVEAACEAMRKACGRRPNLMVLPGAVFSSLKTCDEILATLKSGVAKVSVELLQDLFGIPEILIANAVYNTAKEGDTESLSDVWGDTVGLYYNQPGTGQKTITAAKTFRQRPFRVMRASIPTQHSEWYEPSMVEGLKVTSDVAGYLLTNCNA